MKDNKLIQAVLRNKQMDLLLAKDSDVVKDQNVLLISAMKEELDALVKFLQESNRTYTSTFDANLNREIITFKEKDGSNTINYSATYTGITYYHCPVLQDLVRWLQPDMVIHIGTCATMVGAPFCSVILSNNTYCTDLDLKMFGYIDGSINKEGEREHGEYRGPVFLSGSKFLSSDSLKAKMARRFQGAVAFDMETFMYHEVCRHCGVPYFIAKAVSDDGSNDDFEANLEVASYVSAAYAIELAKRCSYDTLHLAIYGLMKEN